MAYPSANAINPGETLSFKVYNPIELQDMWRVSTIVAGLGVVNQTVIVLKPLPNQ